MPTEHSHPTQHARSESSVPLWARENRMALLVGAYVAATGFFFWRISRQPFSRSVKAEQLESVFKATTLAAVVGGIAIRERTTPD